MEINTSWLKFLREQYPKGSRIRLYEMRDTQPVEAGSEGTLQVIDDMGTNPCEMDNGRTLGVIMGEDYALQIKM